VLTKGEALNLVSKSLDESMSIDYADIIDRDYGWLMFPQSKQFIETGDLEYMVMGSGGILVEKEIGRQIEFGSAYSIETNLKIYELGYLHHENWGIVISGVTSHDEAIDLILSLNFQCVIPEEEYGTVW